MTDSSIFPQCSASCGGGVRSRSVQCLQGGQPAPNCLLSKPAASIACNTHFCPVAERTSESCYGSKSPESPGGGVLGVGTAGLGFPRAENSWLLSGPSSSSILLAKCSLPFSSSFLLAPPSKFIHGPFRLRFCFQRAKSLSYLSYMLLCSKKHL